MQVLPREPQREKEDDMKLTIQRTLHVALWPGVCIAWTLMCAPVAAQTFTTTTVQGTVYLANGRPGTGTLQLSWPAFTTAGNQAVAAGRTNVTIGVDGYVSVNLAPNLGSTPAGLYYTAVYHLSDGTTSTEYWVVPAAAQANLSQVRAQVMPAAQAVQAVSKGYVDQSISELTQSLLTASGGSLSGPLFLNGDPSQSTQAATKRYVDNEFSQAVPLSGGVMSGPLTSVQLGAAYQVDQFPGRDFGAKLQACLNTLNVTYGGTCDGRNFTGTLAMGSTVAVTTANATVELPCATIATTNQIQITAGTRNVTLHGCALRGASDASGSQGGTVFLYSGSGPMIQVGDPTYTVNTVGFHLDNVVINTTASMNSTTLGFIAFRTQELNLEGLYLLGNASQTGMTLDGTGNYTGGTFQDIEFGGFGTALNGIGHQANNPATTDWVNASTFLRLHINCPTSDGSPMAGTYGINLAQGDGNTFTGGDVEGCGTALHLGQNAQNNTIVGLRNENSIQQVVADTGSSYNNWMTGGTMFTGQLTDNGTRNSFLDTFHRSFNGLNGDWYGSQKDATVTNHYRVGTGTGNERGLLDRYQTDSGYRWTTGLSDATAGEQFYQVLDELNNVYRLSIGQYNQGQSSTNNQTVINAAGTGAVVLNGSANSGTGGVIIGAGGLSGAAVATINGAGNAQFNGSLQVAGPSTFSNSTTVKNQSDAEIDTVLWAGSTANQKESVIYKDYTGASQWYMVKDGTNNWALNSATGGLDSFKAYQSYNSGDTYVNASNSGGHIRLNYETGSGTETDIYSGSGSSLVAAFLGTNAIKFPGLASSGGRNCLQIDNSGYISNTGTACATGSGLNGTVNAGNMGQVAYYTGNGTTLAGTSAVGVTSGGTGATSAAAAIANLGAASATALTTETARAQSAEAANASAAVAAQGTANAALPANGATSTGIGTNNSVTFPGNVVASAAVAQKIGGTSYAAQYQTGAGNNGIANCAALGSGVCEADPTYGIPEQYSFTSMLPNVPNAFHFQDQRGGMQQDFYHNFPYPRNATFYGAPAGHATNCLLDAPYTLSATAVYSCALDYFSDTTSGFSIGNSTVPPISNTAWLSGNARAIGYTSLGAGIREGLTVNLQHNGIGDTASGYFYGFSHGGARATSDEGVKFGIGITEDTSQFRGTCQTGCTTGSQAIKLNPTSFGGSQGVGRPFIDITQGPTANNITNLAAGLSGTLEAVTLATPVTASNFWGTLAANVQPNGSDLGSLPYGTVLTFNVNGTSGIPVMNTLMCFASQFHDVITPTSVTGSGPYTITALVRRPHASGSVIMQGGMCGYGMEILANTPSGANPNRYLLDVIGCISTTVCETTFFRLGNGAPGPFITNTGNFNTNIYLNGAVTGLTSNGTTVYATGVTGFPTGWNKTNIQFSGASDSALNNICTGVTFITNALTSFTCTITGISGTHTATTATYVLATATAPLSAVNLWPMAEVLDVQDYNATTCTAAHLAPVCVDGKFALEPNPIAFGTNDTITELNDEAGEYSGLTANISAQNPWSLYRGLLISVSGNAAQGGSGGLSGNTVLSFGNGTADSLYTDSGGSATPPNEIQSGGAYYDWAILGEGPSNGRSIFNVSTPPVNQKANPNYFYNFLSTTNNSGTSTIQVVPFLGDMTLTATGQLGLGGTGGNVHFNSSSDSITFNDRINFVKPTAPTCTVTQGPGTGTLSDGTYFYRIAIRNNASGGPGIPGAECSGTVASGGANSVKISWNRAGGVGVTYYIYGRTTGAELQMTSAGPTVLTFIDNGSITPSGAIPVTDSTLGFVDQAAQMGLNSSGTAFEVTLKAPASQAGNTTVTLPATTGTLALNTAMIASGASHAAGLAPDPGSSAGTTRYLREDATWVAPAVPLKLTISITPAAATASQCVEQTFNTFTGLAVGQGVHVSPPASLGAHIWIGETRVSATNTLAISFCADATAGTPPSGNYIAVAF